jgi:hypothetical protein
MMKMEMKKSKWGRGSTRAGGISSVLYYPNLFVGTREDSRVVLVVLPVMNLIRITSHEKRGRVVFDRKYE